ncbi:MAG: phenylacetate-CoA oxygenase subunit PaaC [Geodermatophilaceae bacterium]|nr:phenylacetate-CoA oxygenase subunit PaaC [Geodermatophilaceae bacterium]
MTTDHDSAYDSLADEHGGDARWAFGTGFDDPLSGVDTAIPGGVEAADLAVYCLMLADDALVMSQRLTEWCTNAPELEEEVALANIGLDLLGQARLLLARAGAADPSIPQRLAADLPHEDALAYFRRAAEYRNVTLVEVDNGDFARSAVRLLAFSTWRLALLDRLTSSRDPVLAAVAAKGVKEVTYHRDYAARWVVRLGDGTDLSHDRVAAGLAATWPYVGELFVSSDVEQRLAAAGVGVDPAGLRAEFDDVMRQVLAAARLQHPAAESTVDIAGRSGRHTEALVSLLAEMQELARAHPEAIW